ncbi:conserved hypothetical protein [Lebetimonas natsushimae]|uniref:diguanylate cyclase n=1 Tax=Lebetimonas natsushimae TaxID=1936991 RepID=A0A292YBQ9_9BACT|nr:GGDEF domain-containing protein [Lebetimonas natsushimae]GAX86953.1 conserved hypothetical protein [Lebetimonas natsushimae]
MIKKWLYYFYILSVIVLILYLALIFIFLKKDREYIANISSIYLEKQLIASKYEQINLIKKVLSNEYDILKKSYKYVQIKEIKKEIKSLKKLLEIILLVDKKNFYIYINNYFSKYKFDFNIEILNEKKTVIASNVFFDNGKKRKLKCNPLKNYGYCEVKNNDYFYSVTFLPYIKVYIVAQKQFAHPPKTYFHPLFLTLKSFPDIIVPNVKGKMDSDHFYIFDMFKPLNLFFGVGINYKKLENFPKKFTKETSTILFHRYLKLIFIMSLIMFVYLVVSTYFLFKLKNLGVKIEKETLYDKLTGLYTRKGLNEFYDKNKILLLLDLDNFKYINDAFGHEKGDEILVKFSELLKEFFDGDIICRWGGDEFIVLTNKSKEKIKRIIEKINEKIEKLQKQFDTKLEKNLSVSCGGSISIKSVEEKFKEADLALYKVKKTTKRGCRFFDELDYVKIENS